MRACARACARVRARASVAWLKAGAPLAVLLRLHHCRWGCVPRNTSAGWLLAIEVGRRGSAPLALPLRRAGR
eukprot:9165223-Alexandrium_andersonii.AAC.1